jgi:hypothetical protein
MLFGDSDLRICSLAELSRHHEGEHSRGIGLPGCGEEFEHQVHVFIERIGDAERGAGRGCLFDTTLLGLLDAAFDLTNVVEIVCKPRAVARAEPALETCRFFGDRVEQASLGLDALKP